MSGRWLRMTRSYLLQETQQYCTVSSLTKEYKSVAEIISPTWQTVVTDYSSRNFWTLASLYYGITWYLLLGESDPLACITKYVEARMVFDVHVQGFLFGSECSCRHLVNLGDAVCTLYVSSCLVELHTASWVVSRYRFPTCLMNPEHRKQSHLYQLPKLLLGLV